MGCFVFYLLFLLFSCGPKEQADRDTGEFQTPEEVIVYQDGTAEFPFIIPVLDNVADYLHEGDTTEALSDINDSYPPYTQDESGPEVFYTFEVTQAAIVQGFLAYPEPSGVDNDLHLLATVEPSSVIDRDHYTVTQLLEAGTYFIVVDTFVSAGNPQSGPYALHVDIEPYHEGSLTDVITLATNEDTALELPFVYTDTRDTSWSDSSAIDTYPPNTLDQSGPEYIYQFRIDERARVTAEIVAPEPAGVDIDVHLLSSLSPVDLIERGNGRVFAVLEPGEYWIVLDTYVAGGVAQMGLYELMVQIRPDEVDPDNYFNETILQAIDEVYAYYGLLGYDINSVFTHDIAYGDYGLIERTNGTRTMCVAGMLEVLLTAMEIYEADTGDSTIWDFLPERSWERLGERDFKAHVWVNHELEAWGTADALRHFGMGETIPFKNLLPGSFVNFSRTSGTGHAVIFIAYIDEDGQEFEVWNEDVVGFLYFSAQGGYSVGNGGFDYRYGVFSEFGALVMPYNRDINIIYREDDQNYFNTGMIFHPDLWWATPYNTQASSRSSFDPDVSLFDAEYFDGITVDDILK